MGQLPFLYAARLMAKGNEEIRGDISVSVWPASRWRSENAGGTFDHEGEAPLDLYDDLRVPNRHLEVTQGPHAGEYDIVTVINHGFVPHCALELRRVSDG